MHTKYQSNPSRDVYVIRVLRNLFTPYNGTGNDDDYVGVSMLQFMQRLIAHHFVAVLKLVAINDGVSQCVMIYTV